MIQPLSPLEVELDGTTLIEASAGTGKTYTITTLVLRLLLERELDVTEILVVTFTRAATAELRDRVRRRLGEMIDAIDALSARRSESALAAGEPVPDATLATLAESRRAHAESDRRRLVTALRDFDQAPILTIHAFCQRTLGEQALESRTPFDLEFLEDESQLVEEVAQDYWARVAYPAPRALVAHLRDVGLDAESLEQLAAQVVRDPEVAVLPAEVAAPEPFDDDAIAAALTRAAALWRDARDHILPLLDPEAGLHKSSYKRDDILRSWAPQLDRMASWEALPPFAARLTQQTLIDKTRKGHNPPRHPFFQAMEELVAADARRRASLDQEVMRIKRGLVDYARAEVARRKQHAAVQSFGDLLTALHRALRSAGGAQLTASIRARYKAALIDEFQDTDPVQYAIFRTLFGDAGLTLFQIGDPKQAIYAFRGADIFTYMNAARRAGERVYTLDRSYRSDPALLRAVNHVFAARAPFLYEDIRYVDLAPRDGAEERLVPPDGVPDRAALQLLFVRRTDERLPSRGKHIRADWAAAPLAERVAGEIVALLESSAMIDGAPIAPRHIAVLCRTNKQAEATQQALMALQVPTVREGDNSVFDTATAEELERVLSAVLQPADARKAHSALATVLLGVSGQTLYRMRQGQDTEGELEGWMERLTAWARLWHERGFVHAFHRLVDDAEIQERLLTRPDGQRRLTDLLHLGELLHTAATAQHLGPLSLLVWLAHMRNDREARGALVGESAQVRLEHDDHAVMLTTIHRSKGLEYPIVFCPYLFSEPIQDRGAVRFHDDSDDHAIKLDIGSDDVDAHKLEARREAMAESLRLLYVALTRAKHRCYVVWGRFRFCGRSPLGYLLHQGDIADADLAADIEPRLAKLDDEAILAEVRGLCDGSGGAMAVRDLDGEDARPYSRPTAARDDLAPRAARRELPALLRSASFSRIVAERAAHVSAPAEDGLDHDEAQPEESRLFGTADRAPVVLHDFPAGSRPGSCIHSVFEHIDFTEVDAGSLREPCSYWLERYGLASGATLGELAASLATGIHQTLNTPLPSVDPSFSLSQLPLAERLDELEFLLPAGSDTRAFDAAALAAVFERHAAPSATPDYHARLAELDFEALSGHLKGFIDLVFRHGERFYLLDYKSNWLGPQPRDYAAPALRAAMTEHDYYLQYHLYTVALHRYLQTRLPDYDYERHCGGALYLFVRGMAPDHPPGTGIFADRPSAALIEDLAAALSPGEAP